MIKEKLSRPMDWIVSCLVAVVLGLVANLFVPYPVSAPFWITVSLSGIRYFIVVFFLLLIIRKRFKMTASDLISANVLKTLSYLFIWVTLLSVFALIKYFLTPASFSLAPDYRFLSPMLLGILIFTPIQTFTEELVFRCSLSHVTSNAFATKTFVLSLISGLLFMVFHIGNPTLSASVQISRTIRIMAYYFILGFFLMFISLKGKSFSPAIGIHMGNNLFIDLVLCQKDNPQLKNPLILYSGDETYLLLAELIFCIGLTMLFYYLTKRREENDGSTQIQKEKG